MDYMHGGDIYTYEGMTDFSANINPFGPEQKVIDAAKAAAKKMGAYPDSRCRKLRSALAKTWDIPEEHLTFGNGAADLIFALVFALRPKKALLTAPCFLEYSQALTAAGCEIVYHYLREEDNFRLTRHFLESIEAETDIIFLCSPDNPTGQTIEKPLLMEIAKKCRINRTVLVLDQCFFEFQENQETVLHPEEAADNPWIFLLRAFTKMHAMPGLRLGYGICANTALLEKLACVRQPWSVSTAAQEAGLAALEGEERVKETRRYVAEERRWLETELRKIGVSCIPSEANYVLLRSEYDLFELLKERHILVRDCSNYEGLEKGYYRAAVKRREDNRKLLAALADIYQAGRAGEEI